MTDHAPVSVSPICPSPMPNKLIFESVGLAGNIHSNFNRRSSAPQFFRKGNSINGIRMRELRNNSGSISLAKATAAVVREIVSDITGIRNEAVFNKNARDSLFTGATDYGKFIAYFHLKYAAIRKAHSGKVVHNLIGKLNRNLRVIGTICSRSINLSTMSSRGTRINMETHKSLSALIDATLNAIKKIITGIIAVLLASKNNLETISFKPILAGSHNLPGKIGLTFTITLGSGIRPAVASIKSDHANVTRRTRRISRDAIRRIGTLQCLLDSLGLDCVSVPICIVNRCALGIHRAIYDGE